MVAGLLARKGLPRQLHTSAAHCTPRARARLPSCACRTADVQADFGLSKTLPINKHAEYGYLDSKFRLTGETGARLLSA